MRGGSAYGRRNTARYGVTLSRHDVVRALAVRHAYATYELAQLAHLGASIVASVVGFVRVFVDYYYARVYDASCRNCCQIVVRVRREY